MAELPEHEERHVREYVDSQGSDDDPVQLVQKVGSHRILGQEYEVYDVQCANSRWWVLTEPMNLYDQTAFPDADLALTFHLGLRLRITDLGRTEIDEEREEHVAGAWRRYEQAVEAMNSAREAEDFQAVGVKCRQALLALVRDHAEEPWVGDPHDRPKAADFKGWGRIFAERLAKDRLRSYLKCLMDTTWDLTVWLQHYENATPWDAEIVVDATAQLLQLVSMLLRRQERGAPERCPRCDSYALDEDSEVVDEPAGGYMKSSVCRACEWRSDRTFVSWEDHFEESGDITGYVERPDTGLSDRLEGQARKGVEDASEEEDARHARPERG